MLFRLKTLLSSSKWIVIFSDGRGEVVKGKVSRRFVKDCERLLLDEGVKAARIDGVNKGTHIGVDFSRAVPGQLHQRIRNLWGEYSE